jgi:hypothetical protein
VQHINDARASFLQTQSARERAAGFIIGAFLLKCV